MSAKTIVEVGCVAAVAAGAIIIYWTGAWWVAIPIAVGLWVGKVVRDALEKDAAAPPAAPPKKGAKN